MSDEILLYTKLSKRIFKFSCTKKYISRKSYAKTVSDDFGNTCKEWALKFVSCKCIFLNLLVADGLMYSRWFWDMRYKSNWKSSFQSYTIYWMQIAYIKSISLLLPDWKSKHVSIWTVLLTLYPFLMTTYFILFPSLPGFTLFSCS